MKRRRIMSGVARRRVSAAFSLLEVLIAIGIFFMVAFTVLTLVSQCLGQARSLQFSRTPIGAIASDAMRKTLLQEGLYNGDFGNVYPDHKWEADVYIPDFATNETLKAIDLSVIRSGQIQPEGRLVILKFDPEAPPREQKGAFWE